MQTAFCPIKQTALELEVDVYQPQKVRDGALKQWLSEKAPDLCLVFAYGRILPPDVLHAPPLGCINLHASLLPRHRGAAPIQWALLEGDPETGISLMQMDEGLDTGPVFTQRRIVIGPRCTGGELTQLMHDLAIEVILHDLALVAHGSSPTPQDHALATHAPPIDKQHLILDFTQTVARLDRQIRAFAPSPGAFCFVGNKRLKILSAMPFSPDSHRPAEAQGALPGTIVAAQGDLLLIETGDGLLRIQSAQAEGKRVMETRDLINGRVLQKGLVLRQEAI
jgi:methionyl-tRNA formyltransferase